MLCPDYHRSVVNLMASLAEGLGAPATGYEPLPELPGRWMHGRQVVLIVVDGLGDEWLACRPESALARHRISRLTSVFPTTTASAVTTFATATAPQQHGITGWYTYLRELGSVATILPFRPRHGGPPYSDFGIEPARFIGSRPFASLIREQTAFVSPSYIVDSPYNRTLAGPAERFGYKSIDGFFAHIHALLQNGGPRYIYAYWPDLDSTSHRFGSESGEAEAAFKAFDVAFERFLEAAPEEAVVIATADHGHTDADPAQMIDLGRHPGLADSLLMPLCGDPRVAFCYVRHGRHKDFRAYAEGELSAYCDVVRSGELLREGYFGLGEPHTELSSRIGDYALIAKGNAVIHDRLPNEQPLELKGVHGGLSPRELYVPLIVVQP